MRQPKAKMGKKWASSILPVLPILPIFTQLDRTSIKLQGFQKQRHRLLPVCVLKALECFWRATKGHRVRQISKSKVKAQVCTTRHKFVRPVGEDFHTRKKIFKKIKKGTTPPGWSHPGDRYSIPSFQMIKMKLKHK